MNKTDKRTHIAQTRRALEDCLLDMQANLADAIQQADLPKIDELIGDIKSQRGLIAALET